MQKGARVRIPEGTEVEVVEVKDDMVRVQLDETGNTFGWYPIDRVQAVRETPAPRMTSDRAAIRPPVEKGN